MKKTNQLMPVVAMLAVAVLCGCADELTPPQDLTLILPDGTRIYRVGNFSPNRLQLERDSDYAVDGAPLGVAAGHAGNLPVHAYPINRYIDPNDPNLMHERHVLYRREMVPDWYLDRDARHQVLIGPTVGETPLSLRPAVVSAELAAEVAKSRQASEIMLRGTKDLTGSAQALIEESKRLRVQLDAVQQTAQAEATKRKEAEAKAAVLVEENKRLSQPREYMGDD